METSRQLGTVAVAYELHSLHGEQWLVAKEAPDFRQLEPLALQLLERGEVDGVRFARRSTYLDHDFVASTVMAKRLRSGVLESDPLQIANPGRDASWCTKPEDLTGDLQRQVMRGLLAKYLDDRRLTPLEVLYSETHAKALDETGTTLQGALQRLASQQMRGTEQSAVARLKELMALCDAWIAKLKADAKAGPPETLVPRQFLELSQRLCARDRTTAPARLYRALAFHLADAKTWLEKLDRLLRLWEPDFGVLETRILDSMAAEMLATPGVLRELASEERSRAEMAIQAIDMCVGNLSAGFKADLPPGVMALSRLLEAGILPRTRAALRLELLRHLHARLPLKAGGIRMEVAAAAEIVAHLRKAAPELFRDEEVLEALALRVDRAVQPEAMAELLAQGRGLAGRIDLILELVESAPGDPAKARLAPYLRSFMAPDDLIREIGGSNRPLAVPGLARIAVRIARSSLPPSARAEMVGVLDGAIFDILRQEVMGNQALAFTDRILLLIKTCGDLPEGRARQFASDSLTQALKRPEFILSYLQRFDDSRKRKAAYLKLCQDLLKSGLVAPQLVPTAA